jgi:hypothetical protein
MKTPDFTITAKPSALDSVNFNRKPKFKGTDNPRHLRALSALMQRPRAREEIDTIAGCSNAPELIAELRRRGFDKDEHLRCDRIHFIDRDGRPCRPGVYSLTEKGRRMVYAWMAKQRKQSRG